MCTLSVRRDGASLILTMNRDELRGRRDEIPPAIRTGGWTGPLDGEKGGTWTGINPAGVTACLLNGYRKDEADSSLPSRGEIVPRVMEAASLNEVRRILRDLLLRRRSRAFHLVACAKEGTRRYFWDGEALCEGEVRDPVFILASSSWNQDEVVSWRETTLSRLLRDKREPEDILAAHRMPSARGPWWGPLVSRTLSATRSITQVNICYSSTRWTMRYWNPPDSGVCASDLRGTLDHPAAATAIQEETA